MTTVTGILVDGIGNPVGTQIRWQPLTAPALGDNGQVISRSMHVIQSDPDDGSWSVDLMAGDWRATWTIGSLVSDIRIRVPADGTYTVDELSAAYDARIGVQLIAWVMAEQFTLQNISDILTTTAVTWPDHRTGVYTCIQPNVLFGVPDAFTMTYIAGATTLTVTQPAVTRDMDGEVIHAPAPTLS